MSARAGSSPLSNWRSVRLWEAGVRQSLRSRHRLWLHGWFIGLIVLAVMWLAAWIQLQMGQESLALRYLLTLGAGYLAYLLVLRLWAHALVRRENAFDPGIGGDLPQPGSGGSHGDKHIEVPQIRSGGGGDFGGGGATAEFGDPADAGSVLGDVAGGALEVAGAADEGALVIIPVVAVFVAGVTMLLGAGALLLLYFGWEALLAVAVEIAFSYVSARTAVRVAREGWLSAVVRLTWKPLLGALACAVLLGGLLDYFVPEARSLPHAIQLMRSR